MLDAGRWQVPEEVGLANQRHDRDGRESPPNQRHEGDAGQPCEPIFQRVTCDTARRFSWFCSPKIAPKRAKTVQKELGAASFGLEMGVLKATCHA